jgi:hypothetical protein
MDTSIITASIGLCGVVVGAAIVAAVNLIGLWHSSRQQKELWAREYKAEQEKALREKLHEIYINCIYYAGSAEYRERDRWLNLLLIYHPNTTNFDSFLEKVKAGGVEANDIIELARKDSRLQGSFIKSSK